MNKAGQATKKKQQKKKRDDTSGCLLDKLDLPLIEEEACWGMAN